jgi:uncharacterized LabA/DUF88 family protein
MHRAEREIIDRLGLPGLTRVLRDLLDQERLIRLAHACGLVYPGMRARSQPRERLLQDVAEKAGHDDAARRAVLKTLQKETGAQRRAWDRLDPEHQAARVREGGGQELFLAASSRGEEAVETAFLAALTGPPPEQGAEAPEERDLEEAAEVEGPERNGREVSRLKKRNLELQKKLQHLEGQAARAREQVKELKRDLIQRKGELAEARMHAERLERDREAREAAAKAARQAASTSDLVEEGELGKALRKLTAEQRKLVHAVEKQAGTPPPPAELPAEALSPLVALLEEIKRETVGSRRERRKDLQTMGQRFEELRADVRAFAESLERHLPRTKRRKGDPERVAVFVDVQNVYYGARQLKGKLDFDALLAAVVRDRRLIKATAYVVESKEIDQSGFIAMLEQRAIDVRRKTLKVRSDGSMKGDWDMEMALDILDAAPNLDVVVLVSGDGDFTSLVHRVKAMGPRVEVIAFPRNTAKSLLEAADHFQPLDRKFMIRTEPQAEEERGGPVVGRLPAAPAPAPREREPETRPTEERAASAGQS